MACNPQTLEDLVTKKDCPYKRLSQQEAHIIGDLAYDLLEETTRPDINESSRLVKQMVVYGMLLDSLDELAQQNGWSKKRIIEAGTQIKQLCIKKKLDYKNQYEKTLELLLTVELGVEEK